MWPNLGLLYFPFLAGLIGPWVRLILSIYAPGADVLARGGACFVRQVQSECLGVKW